MTRVFNIYLISTKGVLPGKDIDRCLQCAPRLVSILPCVLDGLSVRSPDCM